MSRARFRAALFALVCAVSALAAPAAFAITWLPAEVDDPFAPGAKCKVHQLGSMGSYVFQWPSKYDAVFHPFVDDAFIWRCETSGFVSFMDDFERVPADAKPRVAEWLKANPAKVGDLRGQALLDRLEATYRARGMNEPFWAYFYRFRAYRAETGAEGDAFRAKALPLIDARLAGPDLTGTMRMQALYLSGYYRWRAGDRDGARARFAEMRAMPWDEVSADAGSKADNLVYFDAMIADIEAGKLEGDCGQTGTPRPACPAAD